MNVEKQLSSQENHPNIRLKMESSNYFLMIYGQTYGFPINCMARHKAQRAAMSRIEALRSPCCFTLLKKNSKYSFSQYNWNKTVFWAIVR